MKFNSKLFLTTAISAAFIMSPAPAGANLNGTLTTPLAYSDNTYSTQTILAQAGYMQPAQVNGYMDAPTRNAIAGFQQANGLAANGLIDPKTAELLNNAYIGATTQPAYAPQPAQYASAPALAPAMPVEQALYSSNSLAIQQILYKLGFLQTTPNGFMDTQTRSAIMQFQTSSGIPASGEIDELTANALNNAYALGSAYQANGEPRDGHEPYMNSDSTFVKDKWLWAAGGVGVLAGGAAAFAGGGGGTKIVTPNPITFNIPSNDAGNQNYDGVSSFNSFNNPASGVAANYLLGDAANSESLNIMKSNFAQARGYDGRVYNRNAAGVLLNTTFDSYSIVAVVDSGIDFTHPDLDSNILTSDSVTCATGVCSIGGQDTEGHGTEVAGIIAAEDNSIGTVGTAPQAKLISVKNDLTLNSLIAGFDYINYKGVDVINNSYGSDYSLTTPIVAGSQLGVVSAPEIKTVYSTFYNGTNWLAEIQQAVSQHTLLVWAAGNESSDQPNVESSLPFYFDGSVNVANVNGYDWSKNWVSAVSIDDGGTISTFSNKCGVAMNYCLAAPGEVYSTTLGGGYTSNAQGTSFAAPNVSAALAVLLGAYPHLTPEKVLNILFETATDLGTAGTDAIYGRGLVNLDAATNPSGNSSDWTIALSSINSSSFSGSGMNLSSVFGDAMLQNNQRIMFTDVFDKDYQVNLNSLTHSIKDTKTNQERLSEFGSGNFAQEVSLGKDSELAFTLGQKNESNLRTSLGDYNDKHDQNKFMLKQNFSGSSKADAPSFNTALGYNINAADMLGYSSFEQSSKDHLQISDAFKNPYLNLTEYANGASAGYKYANFGVRVAGYEAKDQREEYQFSDGNKTSGNLAEVYYSNDGLSLAVQAGSSRETNTFLGSESGGALQLDSDSPTYFTGVAASYSPVDNFAIKANYNTGTTKLSTSGSSLISNVSDVQSDSFALGVEFQNVNSKDDKFGVSLSQPLRITSASAYATLPEDIAADGTILYQDARLNLSPAGREMDLEAYYNLPLSGTSQLSLGSMVRTEPNHVKDASDEGLLLMKYRAEF